MVVEPTVSPDLSTFLAKRKQCFNVLLKIRQPWRRHDGAAIRRAFAACRRDAHHDAMVALGLSDSDLVVWGIAEPTPADTPAG